MPGSTLESALTPLGERLWCEECRGALQERIRTLIVQWSVVKVFFFHLLQDFKAIQSWHEICVSFTLFTLSFRGPFKITQAYSTHSFLCVMRPDMFTYTTTSSMNPRPLRDSRTSSSVLYTKRVLLALGSTNHTISWHYRARQMYNENALSSTQ